MIANVTNIESIRTAMFLNRSNPPIPVANPLAVAIDMNPGPCAMVPIL